MAKQKHDIGHQKQQRREQQKRSKPKSPDALVRSLIARGIKQKIILGGRP